MCLMRPRFVHHRRSAPLAVLAALASPHRLRILAALKADGRNYVSQLAREVGISRPLLHLHLQKLEEAALVTSKLELSADGKALNYFEVVEFDFDFPTPSAIAGRSPPEPWLPRPPNPIHERRSKCPNTYICSPWLCCLELRCSSLE